MKKILNYLAIGIFCAFCTLSFSALDAHAYDINTAPVKEYSVTPVLGYMRSIANDDSYGVFSYGAQIMRKVGKVEFGMEILGIAEYQDSDDIYDNYQGANISVLGRYYFNDPDQFWLSPFIGMGLGVYTVNEKLFDDKASTGFSVNSDLGLKINVAKYNTHDFDWVIAYRYQYLTAFSDYGTKNNMGAYTGFKVSW